MVDTKNKSSPDLGSDKWQIFVHCDVLVVRYWLGLLSQAGKNSNLCISTASHLILKPDGSNDSPPPQTFSNLPFHHSLCVSCLWPTAFTFDLFLSLSDPSPLMPERPGPWALDNVKRRLRQEQVVRERAASARYRQVEVLWNGAWAHWCRFEVLGRRSAFRAVDKATRQNQVECYWRTRRSILRFETSMTHYLSNWIKIMYSMRFLQKMQMMMSVQMQPTMQIKMMMRHSTP